MLSGSKVEYEFYKYLKKEDAPTAPSIQDKDVVIRVIKWNPIFEDTLSRTYGSRGTLIYIIRTTQAIPTELEDPLQTDCYFGASGCLNEELVAKLPHSVPIYKHDNSSVL